MKRITNIAGQPISELTINPRELVFEYDSVETLRFDNDSKLNNGPEIITIAKFSIAGNIVGSFGLNITGADFGFGYIAVSGTQVVGPQGAAVADATDAASVILRLNELLARDRAHGLIAT